MYTRLLEAQIEQYLFRGRVIVLYGARRVGKTTLVKQLLENHTDKRTRYLNCDLLSVRRALEVEEAATLQAYLGEQDLVVLDEAQQIPNIGRILKILVDEIPEMQVIATGSSSFNLVSQAAEPLTGCMYRFELYPLALQELAGAQGYSAIEPHLEFLLRFGSYPCSVVFPGLWLNPQQYWAGDVAGVLAVLQQGLASPEHTTFVETLAANATNQ